MPQPRFIKLSRLTEDDLKEYYKFTAALGGGGHNHLQTK